MKRNIELKTKYGDLDRAKEVLRGMGAREQAAMSQVDTYFNAPRGRLKLREMGDRVELIWYEREDSARTRGSDYVVARVTDVEGVRSALVGAMGVKVVVKKRREWFLWHNV